MTKTQAAVDEIMAGMKQERHIELSFRPTDGNENFETEIITHAELQKKYGLGRYLIGMAVVPTSVGTTEIKQTTPVVTQIKLVCGDKGLTSAEKVKRIAAIVAAFEKGIDETFLLDTYDR